MNASCLTEAASAVGGCLRRRCRKAANNGITQKIASILLVCALHISSAAGLNDAVVIAHHATQKNVRLNALVHKHV